MYKFYILSTSKIEHGLSACMVNNYHSLNLWIISPYRTENFLNVKFTLKYGIREKRKILKLMFWPRGYKTFFMLNSFEHEILNAHKKNILRNLAFYRLREA